MSPAFRRPHKGQSAREYLAGHYAATAYRRLREGVGIRIDRDEIGGDTIHATGSSSSRSSFGFAGFVSIEGLTFMALFGGWVKYSGRLNLQVPDTSSGPPITHVAITGSVDEPTRVCLRMAINAGGISLVGWPSEPEDSNSEWFYVLHEAYVTDAGTPVYLGSRREDWRLGSPIG